jgi:hypothetical protein
MTRRGTVCACHRNGRASVVAFNLVRLLVGPGLPSRLGTAGAPGGVEVVEGGPVSSPLICFGRGGTLWRKGSAALGQATLSQAGVQHEFGDSKSRCGANSGLNRRHGRWLSWSERGPSRTPTPGSTSDPVRGIAHTTNFETTALVRRGGETDERLFSSVFPMVRLRERYLRGVEALDQRCTLPHA